jgi:hypothetical protein
MSTVLLQADNEWKVASLSWNAANNAGDVCLVPLRDRRGRDSGDRCNDNEKRLGCHGEQRKWDLLVGAGKG